MKKTKWLLASPLLIAPVVATLPLVTSCHKTTISIGEGLAKHIKFNTTQQGDALNIHMTITDDTYLPNELTSVKVGGKEVAPFGGSNDDYNYYVFTTYSNNTEGWLFIKRFNGSVEVDGTTTTLKSISAWGVDVTGADRAEFEVGEEFRYETPRIAVAATMENGDWIELTGGYTIALEDSKFIPGYVFKEADLTTSEKTATITFDGKTTTVSYSIIKAVVAVTSYLQDEESDWEYTKYSEVYNGTDGAIDIYNNSSDTGEYVINLFHGDYEFTQNIIINEKANTQFTLKSAIEPYVDPEFSYFPVRFTPKLPSGQTSLIKIVPSAADTTGGSIDISGIEFEKPETTEIKFRDVVIDATTANQKAHDITIDSCNFIGDSKGTISIDGVIVDGTAAIPTNITIMNSIGSYLKTLFYGWIAPNNDPLTTYDFQILNSALSNSKQLFQVSGTDIVARIALVSAGLMWTSDESSAKDSGMNIIGSGTFVFDACLFTAINELATGNPGGFVQIMGAGANHTLKFNNCVIDTESIGTNGYDVYNSGTGVGHIYWNNDTTEAKALSGGLGWRHTA